jgi:nitroreductase
MDVFEAIRKRRAVRTYTDRPVTDEVLDRLLRSSLRAPTGSGAQAWGLMVIRDAEKRQAVADLVIDGGAKYFAIMRPQKEGVSDEEHAAWGKAYAEQILATYRIAPVWIVGLLVPRFDYPEVMKAGGREDDVLSLGFVFENLMLTARAEGIGTVPTTAFQRFEMERLRSILEVPAEVTPMIVSPLGYPEAWPEGLAPALKRNFQGWKALVHDDQYGATRA